jgi:hypothetical protein
MSIIATSDSGCPPGMVPSGSGCTTAAIDKTVTGPGATTDKTVAGPGAVTDKTVAAPNLAPANFEFQPGGGSKASQLKAAGFQGQQADTAVSGINKKDKIGPLGELYSTQQTIMDNLNKAISGESTRWDDAAVQDLYAGIISDAESGKRASEQGLYADAARRGLLRSAAAGSQVNQATLMAQAQRSQGLKEARIQVKTQQWDDKMGALDRAQKNLDTLRQYELGKEQNAVQREQIGAQMAIASMQVEAQKESMLMQFAQDKEMSTMKYDQATQTQDSCLKFFKSFNPEGAASCF